LVACKFTPKVSIRLYSAAVDNFETEDTSTPSTSSTPCSTSWSLPSTALLPKSTDPAFIGYIIKHDLNKWVILEKTANKRGGTSWIWEYGPELRQLNKQPAKKPHWLCKLCWDKKKIFMSAETERVFSDTKLFIPESRSHLGPAVIEALNFVNPVLASKTN
jgi:hypothetical protein